MKLGSVVAVDETVKLTQCLNRLPEPHHVAKHAAVRFSRRIFAVALYKSVQIKVLPVGDMIYHECYSEQLHDS